MAAGLYLRRAWIGLWYRLLFARLTGHRMIIRDNLARAFPDYSGLARWWLRRRILIGQGRFMGEALNMDRLIAACPDPVFEGPGHGALLDAVEQGRPVLLLSGHVGNYVLGLDFLRRMGVEAGFLYRRRGNVVLDDRFDTALKQTGQTGYKISHRSRSGYEGNLKGFIDLIDQGKVAVMLGDHRDKRGEKIRFLGRPAPTSLTPARLALAHDALLIPCFVFRQGAGFAFRARLEAPIRHSNPVAMMRQFNDHLSQVIEQDPTQWSWTIRRW